MKNNYGRLSLNRYLKMVGAATATPGGGSVSAIGSALGAALGMMVSGLTLKKSALSKQFRHNYQQMLGLAEADSEAYEEVLRAYRLPPDVTSGREKLIRPVRSPSPRGDGVLMSPDATIRGTPHPKASESIGATSNGVRTAKIQAAFLKAVKVPLNGMLISLQNIMSLNMLVDKVRPNLMSDLAVAVLFSYAAFQGCLMNVRINLPYIKDKSFKRQVNKSVMSLNRKMNKFYQKAQTKIHKIL